MMTTFLKRLSVCLIIVSCIACSETPPDFTLKGNIKGLKKGVVYLQRQGDSTLITIDSLEIKGSPDFVLQSELKEPEVLFLKLFKNDGEEHIIPFFADKGVTEINTTLTNFRYDAKVIGSEQHKVLEEYIKLMDSYNDRNLEIIKQSFLAQKAQDSMAIDSLNTRSDRLFRLKYFSTINFAKNNSDSEVAPYLALYEIPSANSKYLDTIYNALSDRIKDSKYGKKLSEVIEERNASIQ